VQQQACATSSCLQPTAQQLQINQIANQIDPVHEYNEMGLVRALTISGAAESYPAAQQQHCPANRCCLPGHSSSTAKGAQMLARVLLNSIVDAYTFVVVSAKTGSF
jgi:hypothetical protein